MSERQSYLCNRVMGAPEPLAVVNVVETRENFDTHLGFLCDRRCRVHAPLQRAGVDDRWLPKSRNPVRRLACLSNTALGQFDVRATPKPFGGDPRNVTMSHQ